MKNIRRLLAIAAALVSSTSMALLQPALPISEDAPTRITAGVVGDMALKNNDFGLTDMGAGFGVAYNVGYDLFFAGSLKGSYSSHSHHIFTDSGKETSGFRLDAEVMAAFLPELSDGCYFGGVLGVGFGRQFGEKAKALNGLSKFGDMSFHIGPAMSYDFNDVFRAYINPSLTMKYIRFAISDDASQDFKDKSNTLGLAVPVGFAVSLNETSDLFFEANTQFDNLKHFGKSFNETLTLGVAFSI